MAPLFLAIRVTNGTFPTSPLSAKLALCPPEPAQPSTVALNARGRKTAANATSTAASARPPSKSASARMVSCTAKPAAPPATTRLRINCPKLDSNSDHHCFPILPKYPPHRIGNLTHGRERFDCRQDSRHHILPRARRVLDRLQCRFPRPGIPPRPQRTHSFDLFRLQRRIDLLNRNRFSSSTSNRFTPTTTASPRSTACCVSYAAF